MKAVQYQADGTIRLIDLPIPTIGPGELLVRIAACGVCAAETLEWYMRSKAPLVLGHEPAGTIVKVGRDVSRFRVGDRVFVHHRAPCGACHLCLHGRETLCPQHRQTQLEPGGLAEYVRVHASVVEKDVLLLPDELSFEHATLIEPVSCCVRALGRLAIDDESVVVIAGAGFAGLVFVQLVGHVGARSIAVVEPIASRRRAAVDLGAALAFHPEESDLRARLVSSFGRPASFVIVTASSVHAVEQALELADKGATVLLFAPAHGRPASIDLERLFFNEWTITSSYGSDPNDTRLAMRLIQGGIIYADRLVTDRFPLDQAATAIALTARPGDSLKCVIEIGEREISREFPAN